VNENTLSALRTYADRHWCALHTRARHEKKVATVCGNLQVPNYLPLRPHRTFSGGKTNTFQLPMFPGYVFAALAPGDLLSLKKTNSIAQKIETHDEPGLLRDLSSVQTIERSQLELFTTPVLKEGQKVLVTRGPLAGVTGTVLRYKNRTRLQVVIEAIQQAILLDVSQEVLAPLSTWDECREQT